MDLQSLINAILTTYPYQLPPVIASNGTYLLDVKYRGFKLHHVGITPEESLYRYLHFVRGVNQKIGMGKAPAADAPTPPGSQIHPNANQLLKS